MRPNETAQTLTVAQPVVSPVPQPDDESDVAFVGTVPHAVYRYSSLPFALL